MQFGARENPGHYDNRDYDYDNDNDAKSNLQWTCLTD